MPADRLRLGPSDGTGRSGSGATFRGSRLTEHRTASQPSLPLRGVPLLVVSLLLCGAGHAVQAQEILLDRVVEMAGVTLFASRSDPHAWYYLPDSPRVAERDGVPEFSLVKYTAPPTATGGGGQGITAARGGGVLHLLAVYGVSDDRLQRAADALRAVPERKEDRIAGPIVFRAGTFALVSSVASTGGMARRISGMGPAPVLEGGKVAVSVELDPEGATFLWQSFTMESPDVSLAFSMEVEGYRTPYEAELVADWDRLYSRRDIQARLKVVWFGFDVKVLVDECFSNGTIRLDVKGESSSLQPLLEAAHAKIASLLFDPLPQAPPPQEASAGGVLGALLGSARRNYVDLFAGYQMTRQRLAGSARIRLAQQRAERLHALLTGSIGPLGRRWRTDQRFFRTISLEDPAFRQREIAVSLDGDVTAFASAVERLVVQLEKRHGDGSVTMREGMLDPRTLSETGNRLLFVYPNAGDADLQEWLRYRYRAVWSFRGGRQHDSGWQDADAFALSLHPPYAVRRVSFEGDPAALSSAGVRSVLVTVSWEFLGQPRTERITLRPGAWSREVELVLPDEQPAVSVTLTWHLAGGRTLQRGPFNEDSEIVYVDEIPATAGQASAPAQGGLS